MASLAWFKLFDAWWSSRSHNDISGVALAVGARCLSIANASPVRGEVLTAASKPKPVASLAREVRFPEQVVCEALDELVACGTLVLTPEGVLRFPNFLQWQESPSASRMRKKRESDAHSDAHGDGGGDAPVTTEGRGQRLEVRVKKEEGKQEQVSEADASSPPAEPVVVIDISPAPKKKASYAADVRRLTAFWHNCYKALHPRSHLPTYSSADAEYTKMVARLKNRGVEELESAIAGAFRTPHNLGDNDRQNEYLGLTVIMKDDSNVTRFIANSTKRRLPTRATAKYSHNQQVLDDWGRAKEEQDRRNT